MFEAHARWFLLAGLSTSALLACGGDDPPGGGTAGTSAGGTSAGSGVQSGGSSGTGTTAGSTSGGAAGSMSAGTGGGGAASGGMSGGTAGATGGGGAGGSGGGGGSGGAPGKTAVAKIMGLGGKTVTGTATFTQEATMTKLVIDITACPDGPMVSHLHQVKDCGDNGNAAMNHWPTNPDDQVFGNYPCSAGKATHMAMKPTSIWTIGGDEATDITQHSFMVHEGSDPAPGGRIGCGVVDAQ
jgi:Cu/Zn superoxide dismutase